MVEVRDPIAPKRNAAGILLAVLVAFLCLTLTGGALAGWLLLERAECGTGDYTLRDELRVKTFAFGIFRAPEWTETYSTEPFHIMRAWLSETYNAVVFVDYLLYNCGHTQADRDAYFSDESFRTQILANYQDVEKIAVCNDGDTTLYIYTARLGGYDYLTHTWAIPDGKYRILEVFMAFPASQQDMLNEYARRLFPKLSSCP